MSGTLEQWEAEAEAFHRATGYLRPDKDTWSGLGDEKVRRTAHWRTWCAGAEYATPKWIKCSEWMPANNEAVNVHCALADEYGSWTGAGFYIPEGWQSQDSAMLSHPLAFVVTHWQPLPAPPGP